MEFITNSENETEELGSRLAEKLEPGTAPTPMSRASISQKARSLS